MPSMWGRYALPARRRRPALPHHNGGWTHYCSGSIYRRKALQTRNLGSHGNVAAPNVNPQHGSPANVQGRCYRPAMGAAHARVWIIEYI